MRIHLAGFTFSAAGLSRIGADLARSGAAGAAMQAILTSAKSGQAFPVHREFKMEYINAEIKWR
jgi:hypothetical protein